jgi:hypothetical protein
VRYRWRDVLEFLQEHVRHSTSEPESPSDAGEGFRVSRTGACQGPLPAADTDILDRSQPIHSHQADRAPPRHLKRIDTARGPRLTQCDDANRGSLK